MYETVEETDTFTERDRSWIDTISQDDMRPGVESRPGTFNSYNLVLSRDRPCPYPLDPFSNVHLRTPIPSIPTLIPANVDPRDFCLRFSTLRSRHLVRPKLWLSLVSVHKDGRNGKDVPGPYCKAPSKVRKPTSVSSTELMNSRKTTVVKE